VVQSQAPTFDLGLIKTSKKAQNPSKKWPLDALNKVPWSSMKFKKNYAFCRHHHDSSKETNPKIIVFVNRVEEMTI